MATKDQVPELRRAMIISSFWSLLEVASDRLLALGILLLLARLIGPEQFGLVSIALALSVMLQAVSLSGFANAVVQREELSEEHVASAFWANVLLSGLLTACMFGAAPFMADVYGQESLSSILQAMSATVFLVGTMSVPAATLRREFRYKWLALRPLAATLPSGSVSISLAFLGYGAWALVAYYVLYMFGNTTLILIATRWCPRLVLRWNCMRDLLGFSLADMSLQLLAVASTRCRDLIVGYYLGVTAAGHLRIAQQIIDLLTNLIVMPVERVNLTGMSKLQTDLPRAGRVYLSMVLIVGAVGIPSAGGLIIVLPEAVELLLGPEWAESAVAGQILASVFVYYCFGFLLQSALQAVNRSRSVLRFSLLEFVGLQIITLLAAPYGLAAVVAADVAFSYVTAPYAFWLLDRYLNVRPVDVLQQLLPSTTATVIMVVIGLDVNGWLESLLPPLGVLAVEIALGSAVYLLVLRLGWPKFLSRIVDTVSPTHAQWIRSMPFGRFLIP